MPPLTQIAHEAAQYNGHYGWKGYSNMLNRIAEIVIANNLSREEAIQAIKQGLSNSGALLNDTYCTNMAVLGWENIQKRIK